MAADDAFLRAVAAEPDDDGPRLAYADWLDEHGEPDRAEFVRGQCELERLPRGDPRRPALAARCRRLEAVNVRAWLGPLATPEARWRFRRGFLESISLKAAPYVRHFDAIQSLLPRPDITIDVYQFAVTAPGLPGQEAHRLFALPLAETALGTVVAMADPGDRAAVARVGQLLGRAVLPVRAATGLREMIVRQHGPGPFPPDPPRPEPGGWEILVPNVARYLDQPGAPVRGVPVPFTWADPPGPGEDGPVRVEAVYDDRHAGTAMRYTLTANLPAVPPNGPPVRYHDLWGSGRCSDSPRRDYRPRPTLTDADLTDVVVRYSDDAIEAEGLGPGDVPHLIDELYLPDGRLDVAWASYGGLSNRSGPSLLFSGPMRKLVFIGPSARAALHARLDDPLIEYEVVALLGLLGDETTIPLLLDRYAGLDYCPGKGTLCYSFALAHLTEGAIDRDGDGTDADHDGRLWRRWWARNGRTFRVNQNRPQDTVAVSPEAIRGRRELFLRDLAAQWEEIEQAFAEIRPPARTPRAGRRGRGAAPP